MQRCAAALIGLSLLFSGCDTLVTDVVRPELAPQHGITQTSDYCQRDPKCSGYADPDSAAPGIFLGTDITLDGCWTALTDDRDGDGFKDYCEKLIAEFFRPLMRFSGGETDAGREPYWAVRFDEAAIAVKLFYAFAYYIDGGTDHPACNSPFSGDCAGHYGDSEWVEVTVKFNAATKHWVTMQGIYSQHGQGVIYPYSALEYPSKYRGHPSVYVAVSKHANYNSDSSCDDGGALGFDACNAGGVDEREYFDANRNLGKSGSSSTKLIDCVGSTGPFIGNGRVECFWTTTGTFNGWQTATSTEQQIVAPYGQPLYTLGY